MTILFIAPRYHTNQIPIITGLINRGHQVKYFVSKIGATEDHSILVPVLIQPSVLTRIVLYFFRKKCNANTFDHVSIKKYSPSFLHLLSEFKKNRPDIVILRERSKFSLFAYIICRMLEIKPCIIYNQTPLFNDEAPKLYKTIWRKLFPKVRMTPVLVSNSDYLSDVGIVHLRKPHEYFIPFIQNVCIETVAHRKYVVDGEYHILSVGKYREYKNHFLLVDAISLLKNIDNIKVTIVGQVTNSNEAEYFDTLSRYIQSKHLDHVIKCEKNFKFSCMQQLYIENDIFILTSHVECASISILEAMSFGLVTLSTNQNGTATYIKQYETGYTFQTNNVNDLTKKIELLLDKAVIMKFGNKAFQKVRNLYSFENYLNLLNQMLLTEFDIYI